MYYIIIIIFQLKVHLIFLADKIVILFGENIYAYELIIHYLISIKNY